MVLDRLRIACWRFELISPYLTKHFSASERSRHLKVLSKQPVVWPSGRMNTVSLAALYRWIKDYQNDPRIESLMPSIREKRDTPCPISKEWLQYALALLEENPERSLYFLTVQLKEQFQLSVLPSRSSLHRALQNDPRYGEVRKRIKGEKRIRQRFEAKFIHQIWQGDGKGKFKVLFEDGREKYIQALIILEDKTRYILRALIVDSESIVSAVKCFQEAAARYGLPDSFYLDRGSAYDSDIFRIGLAILGVNRIKTKPRNPEARGKLERFNRTLEGWFVKELKHRIIQDEAHLQKILDHTIEKLYHPHIHKELKMSSQKAFGNTLSKRLVTLEQLKEAFLFRKTCSVDIKTRNIRINGKLFKMPSGTPYRKQILVAYDPVYPEEPFILGEHKEKIILQPAVRITEKISPEPTDRLIPLMETCGKRILPKAYGGFGLPEIYQSFTHVLGRAVPETQTEANRVIAWLKINGPFDPVAFQKALESVLNKIGSHRPLTTILDHLTQTIQKKETR